MTRFVLDASVALRWFLDKPVPPSATAIKRLLLGGAQALVPALWHLEMANAFVVAERRRVLGVPEFDRALRDVELLLGHVIETDPAISSLRQASETARQFGLSAYDATYLNLARREALPLATLDGPLRTAAKQAGVDIL